MLYTIYIGIGFQCSEGLVRLEERVQVHLNNGTSIIIGRPEVCKYGVYVPICNSSLNSAELSQHICNHFGSYDSKLMNEYMYNNNHMCL